MSLKLLTWYSKFVKLTRPKLSKTTVMAGGKKLSVSGFAEPGFEHVLETFRSNLDSGLEQGGSFAAYYQGRLVVNVWGGYSDPDCRRLWKEDTLSTFFSTTKALAAFTIAHMVDRGLLDYKARVSKYWPDFAQNGKETVTLEQLISNQAGLITLKEPFWLAELKNDPAKLGRKLAAQKPYWKPGEVHGYHPLTFGLYLDQMVRHADPQHRSLAEYFHQEIAQPFGLEIYIGLPKPLYHRATRVKFTRELDIQEMLGKFRGQIELLRETGNNPKDFRTTLKVNDPDNRELPVPSTHGHATAANMARLFGIIANGGSENGKQLLSKKAIDRFTEPIVAGIDVSFGMDAAWSVGTHLITMVTGDQDPHHIFGHGGYGGQYGAADTKHRLSFAYTTPFLDPFASYSDNGDERMYSLVNALYDCVFKVENVQEKRHMFQFHSQFKQHMEKKQSPGSKL